MWPADRRRGRTGLQRRASRRSRKMRIGFFLNFQKLMSIIAFESSFGTSNLDFRASDLYVWRPILTIKLFFIKLKVAPLVLADVPRPNLIRRQPADVERTRARTVIRGCRKKLKIIEIVFSVTLNQFL